jgi:hypothetical protein
MINLFHITKMEQERELKFKRFMYVLSKMVNQPTTMAEKERREQLITDEDFTQLYIEMIQCFKKQRGDYSNQIISFANSIFQQ